MMYHVRFTYTLVLMGPILTQATAMGSMGLDAPVARLPDGRPYLPYSLIRGKLREALTRLHAVLSQRDKNTESSPSFTPSLRTLFGNDNDEEVAGELRDNRGLLRFGDFIHPWVREGEIVTRIKMNADTETVDPRMLVFMESLFQTGEKAEFCGEVSFIATSLDQIESIENLLMAGFHHARQFGAGRTIGYGQLVAVRLDGVRIVDYTGSTKSAELVKPVQQRQPSAMTTLSALPIQTPPVDCDGRIALRIRPQGAFCFAKPRRFGNIFETEDVIPGAALKGAIATTIAAGDKTYFNALHESLHAVRISHAFPARRGRPRPAQIPLSLVAAEPSQEHVPIALRDAIFCPEPTLVCRGEEFVPPVFSADWKRDVTRAATKQFGWPDITRDLRVRTAIASEFRRASDQQLFAYEMVWPSDLEWLGVLDVSRIKPGEDRQKVVCQLQQLLAPGLGPLGKTKVEADITLIAMEELSNSVPSSLAPMGFSRTGLPEIAGNKDHYWVVTLQTPALLCSLVKLQSELAGEDSERFSSQHLLLQEYQRIWHELSKGTLELVRFFARQSLTGGYLSRRFSPACYTNHLLTVPGSTFLLKATKHSAEALPHLKDWLAHGLPLADSLCQGFKPTDRTAWQQMPFLPENGFGEIAINPPWCFGQALAEGWPTPLVLSESSATGEVSHA